MLFNSRASMEAWFAGFWILTLYFLRIGVAQDLLPECAATCFDNMQSLYFIGICVTDGCDCEKLYTAPAGPYMGNCVDETCSSSNKTAFDEWFQTLCGTSWPPAFTTTASLETFPVDTATATSEVATNNPVTSATVALTSSTTTSSPTLTSSTTPTEPLSNSPTSATLTTSPSTTSTSSLSTSSSSTAISRPTTASSSLPSFKAASSTPPTSTPSSGLSTGASAGISVGVGLAGILAIGILVFWLTRRKYRKVQSQANNTMMPPQLAEIQGNARGELQGSGYGGWELEGSRGLGNELDGSAPGPIELGTYR